MVFHTLTLKLYLGYCSTPCHIFCLISVNSLALLTYTFMLELRVTVVNLGITVLTCGHIYDSSGVQLYPTVVFVQMYFFQCHFNVLLVDHMF